MADDLVISVGGDISSLESSLADIPSVAADSAAKIQAAFDALPSATEGIESSLANLSSGLQEAGAAAGEAAGHIEAVPPALHDTEEAASEANEKLAEFVKTGLELAGIAVSLEGIKEALTETVAAFEQVQRAEISLTALSGSAEQARSTIDQLRTLAQSEGLSFPALLTAQTRMQAFGISTQQIPGLLQAAANAAAVMSKDIETTVNVLDRMAASGAAGARQLSQLGLTTHDLAQAMGVADSAVTQAFKDLDQTQRVQVLTDALQKFQGVAASLADTLSGRWQTLKTSIEVATEGIGESIASGLTDVVKQAQTSVVPALEAITQAFKDVSAVVGPVLVGAVNSLVQGFSELAELASGAISLAIRAVTGDARALNVDLKSVWDRITDLTPWALFKDSMDQATTELHLLSAAADMAAKSIPIMEQRFTSATDALKSFIDKTSAGHDSLLAIRTEYESLQKTLTDAQQNLAKVTEAVSKHEAGLGQLQAAQKAVQDAQTKLNGTWEETGFTIGKVTDAMDKLISSNISSIIQQQAKDLVAVSDAWKLTQQTITQNQTALDDFTGSALELPKVFDETTAKAVALQNGIEMLAGSVTDLNDAFDATKVTVVGAGNAFTQTAADLIDYINQAQAATTATNDLASAAQAAGSAAGSLGSQLDAAMASPSEGGGSLGLRLSLQPGDTFQMPFVGNPTHLVGVGAIGAGYNAFTQAQETQGVFGGGTIQHIGRAAQAITTAAQALTDAAQAQQDAATAAYEAAKASGTAAKDISAAATANDAISASTLAAADAANAAAFNASVIGTQVLGTVTQATQTVAAATALVGATVTAVAPALGISLGTNALVPGAPTPVTPAITGPGGSNTLVIPMPVNTGPWDPTVGGQARLQLTLNNSGPIVGSGGMDQLVSILGDNLVKQLQTQGIRLTRA